MFRRGTMRLILLIALAFIAVFTMLARVSLIERQNRQAEARSMKLHAEIRAQWVGTCPAPQPSD
ncbi:MAG: hypothetical protein IMZ62_09950 [Chloroflexi bacterium]|nr:hypothetical protein [Chloroflexota bacterium]